MLVVLVRSSRDGRIKIITASAASLIVIGLLFAGVLSICYPILELQKQLS